MENIQLCAIFLPNLKTTINGKSVHFCPFILEKNKVQLIHETFDQTEI